MEHSLTTLLEAHCELQSLKAHWITELWLHIALKVWRKERSLTTPSEAHCELRKSEGTLNYESLKANCFESLNEGTFVDNTFRGTLRITKVWRHIELRKSEGRNVRWQHLQRHIANYESLKAHWVMKVWRHITLKVWRKECSLTTPSEAHCKLWKSEGTLNYESLKAHYSENLKEGTLVDNTFRGTLWIMKV
jgi:hypothetical protein